MGFTGKTTLEVPEIWYNTVKARVYPGGKNLGTEKIKELKPLLESLKEVVKERYKAEILGIFGSYSRGEEREQSDLDILVRFEEDADLIHFIGLSLFLEEKLSLKVDVVPYDAIRKEFKDIILRETVYL